IDDPPQIVDHQLTRNALAIGKAVCISHRPTARCDCFGAGRGDCLGAACVPDVEEYKWFSGDMQSPELFNLVDLSGYDCHRDPFSAACQCPRNSLSNSAQRSSGKKILALLNSTRRRVPGMVSASQWDHFTSK